MYSQNRLADEKLLRSFSSMKSLSQAQIDELVSNSTISILPAGEVLFEIGDQDNRGVFLVSGDVLMRAPNFPAMTVQAGSDPASTALAHHQPRQVSAYAKTDIEILTIDAELLDVVLSWTQKAVCEVPETQPSTQEEWTDSLWQSTVFSSLPQKKRYALRSAIEEVPAKKGQVIITQGEVHDCYYILKAGRCKVSKRVPGGGESIVAELNVGQGFGEEALITGGGRNASVTMLEDGVLLRLGKKDFITHLLDPLLNYISVRTFKERNPNTVVLDVRTPNEFSTGAIRGSISVPLPVLRLKANRLNKRHSYIVCCDNGKRSVVAAFVLKQYGLKVSVLGGGLNRVLFGNSETDSDAVATGKVEAKSKQPAKKRGTTIKKKQKSGAAQGAEPVSGSSNKKGEKEGGEEENVNAADAPSPIGATQRSEQLQTEAQTAKLKTLAAEEARHQAEEELKRLRDELRKEQEGFEPDAQPETVAQGASTAPAVGVEVNAEKTIIWEIASDYWGCPAVDVGVDGEEDMSLFPPPANPVAEAIAPAAPPPPAPTPPAAKESAPADTVLTQIVVDDSCENDYDDEFESAVDKKMLAMVAALVIAIIAGGLFIAQDDSATDYIAEQAEKLPELPATEIAAATENIQKMLPELPKPGQQAIDLQKDIMALKKKIAEQKIINQRAKFFERQLVKVKAEAELRFKERLLAEEAK
ncbi:MAG: cyclic nucleotide-binding domain-containing protein [Gammaproteobacteria bacterium]|nr:cyclic nucleotide-binding domain-containing protein [Gammaproteobacteria bacterium]